MIVGSYTPYKIGEIVVGDYKRNIDEVYSDVHLFIVRESSEEEWIKYRTENGLDIIPIDRWKQTYWYEVTTD